MSLSHRYRNFGGPKAPDPQEAEANIAVTEDQQLEAFEKGYQAGWDDAVKAQSDSTAKISAELGQNLQDMSFTYNEALSKLTLSLKPILTEIVDKLLPSIAQSTLGPKIVDQLMEMIKEQPHQPIEIVVSPVNIEAIQTLAAEKLKDPFEVVGEPSLGDGQAYVRIGDTERSVDLEAVLSGVSSALTAFFHETEQENKNG
ncbi:ABC transporter ATP-binding protein [uncultured Roseobacter sp.]|uniref:FliH/SctL family protein n=1 Tax=uncultured Roseobacter sp. TaxID=114847 RepID=UPI002616B487|nr:ABC transporter ATP-binding protein [uncultured Roseobacter sp.]